MVDSESMAEQFQDTAPKPQPQFWWVATFIDGYFDRVQWFRSFQGAQGFVDGWNYAGLCLAEHITAVDRQNDHVVQGNYHREQWKLMCDAVKVGPPDA